MSGSSWFDCAWGHIMIAHKGIPEGATLKERKAIIDEAYPFGQRKMFPYKMWLKARKKYLNRYDQKPMKWG